MTTAEALKKARDLYAAHPSHCHPDDMPKAGRYCPLTAIGEFGNVTESEEYPAEALRAAAGLRDHPYDSIVGWNHSSTTAEVLAAFDRAIGATS